jgi:dTDP-4-amino-4,6-dideoxygalactose transaminase
VSVETDHQDVRVAFIEPKSPDWDRVVRICETSRRTGRWANFGPVNAALAEAIASVLDLPEDRAVVPAASATAALMAIGGMRAARLGHPLRWLVSAYSFFSPSIGGFGSRIVTTDCDGQGLLDLDEAARVPEDSYDGMVVTNVFGLAADPGPYIEFCAERGKALLVDNALALEAPRSPAAPYDEIISFHHTKPWGFGEGGCAVVDRRDADLVKSFLNFGVGADPRFREFAANGKLSDLAAAAILDRLERLSQWGPSYRVQRRRIAQLARRAGLQVMGEPPGDAITPHVPVLAQAAVPLDALPAARFDVARYYRPLAPGHPNAERLYARMINVPCHPGMAAVTDEELEAFFRAVKEQRR